MKDKIPTKVTYERNGKTVTSTVYKNPENASTNRTSRVKTSRSKNKSYPDGYEAIRRNPDSDKRDRFLRDNLNFKMVLV